ncbi:MAG: hypothetical protein ACR2P1_02545 [Pseudomonadales bacterium]
MSYGAIIKSIQLDNSSGRKYNLVLGYDDLQFYVNKSGFWF